MDDKLDALLLATRNDRAISIDFLGLPVGASRRSVRVALVRNGRAMAGDGVDVDDLEAKFSVVVFKADLVDRTSIQGDVTWSALENDRITIVESWLDSVGAMERAVGVVVDVQAGGFLMGEQVHDMEAIRLLSDESIDAATAQTDQEPAHRFFTEVSVSGFRGFASKKTLLLAVPNGEDGSGLTVVVGANNSGKSTFVEAVQYLARGRISGELSFPQPRRHRDLDRVELEMHRNDGRFLRIASTRRGGSQASATWGPSDSSGERFDIQVTPARRSFSPYFGGMGTPDRNWGLSNQDFSRTDLRDNFTGRLRQVDRDPKLREVFDGLLKRILGYELNWTLDEVSANQQFVKLIEPDGAWHTSEGLGDGLVSLLFIVDALYDAPPGSLVAIDEPELSLHPQLVRRLGRVLSEYSRERQILITTHSPHLLAWSDVENGATVARVYKRHGKAELAQASRKSLLAVATLNDSRNPKNPHAVGTAAREALFLEDGVVLVEGQDDAAYLPRVLRDLDLPPLENIYGWGSGGVGNIPKIATLFRELGFSRIGAVVDNDGEPGTKAAIEKLIRMKPEVLVIQIPAPDIRHKPAVDKRAEVRGLLDEGNEVVREDLREETTSVLGRLIDHVGQ